MTRPAPQTRRLRPKNAAETPHYNKTMPDEDGIPTVEDLEQFRKELVSELELTREEVRKAFEAAAEPIRTVLPELRAQIAFLEERVKALELHSLTNQWPQPPVC